MLSPDERAQWRERAENTLGMPAEHDGPARFILALLDALDHTEAERDGIQAERDLLREAHPHSAGLAMRLLAAERALAQFVDEGGLDRHLPMPLTAEGQGPAEGDEIDHYGCWCADPACIWNRAFVEAATDSTPVPAVEPTVPLSLAERLLPDLPWDDCELVGRSGSGRCIEPAVAVRWEDGFLDEVCEHHAHRAAARGAVVVWGKPQPSTNRRPAWERG